MKIRWLGWARVELRASGESLVIDLLGRPEGVLEDTTLEAPMPTVVPPESEGDVLAGLCTHLHRDHADAGALTSALRPGGRVLHPAPFGGDDHENLWTLKADAELDQHSLPRSTMNYWQTTRIGPFTIAAVPPSTPWATHTSPGPSRPTGSASSTSGTPCSTGTGGEQPTVTGRSTQF